MRTPVVLSPNVWHQVVTLVDSGYSSVRILRTRNRYGVHYMDMLLVLTTSVHLSSNDDAVNVA